MLASLPSGRHGHFLHLRPFPGARSHSLSYRVRSSEAQASLLSSSPANSGTWACPVSLLFTHSTLEGAETTFGRVQGTPGQTTWTRGIEEPTCRKDGLSAELLTVAAQLRRDTVFRPSLCRRVIGWVLKKKLLSHSLGRNVLPMNGRGRTAEPGRGRGCTAAWVQ